MGSFKNKMKKFAATTVLTVNQALAVDLGVGNTVLTNALGTVYSEPLVNIIKENLVDPVRDPNWESTYVKGIDGAKLNVRTEKKRNAAFDAYIRVREDNYDFDRNNTPDAMKNYFT